MNVERVLKVWIGPGSEETVQAGPVFQYSYGQVLQLEGMELPHTYEVHFASAPNKESKTYFGNAEGVEIPNHLLRTGADIHAWLFLHAGQDDGKTVRHIVIKVIPRAAIGDGEFPADEQPEVTKAIAALADGVRRAEAAAEALDAVSGFTRVSALSGPAAVATAIEAAGIPEYVSDVSAKVEYGLSEPGWYVFSRIAAPEGAVVSAATSVSGAAGAIVEPGADHVDVAVRFGVAAESVTVTVDWGEAAEAFVFKATDLAVRNLDYRTTFYIYDIAPYATWQYALTTDATFVAGKKYYTEADGVYTLAEVTAGEAVPAGTYYNHSKLRFEGMARNITYRLDEIVDCPSEIVLPEIADDTHGCWFEIRCRHAGEYSMTLVPPSSDVKIATEHTQKETAGMNMIDLHYTVIDGIKLWRFLNTHSSIPT